MGQNNSTHVQARAQSGENNIQPKTPRPATPPPAPKIPNYAVPENLVLPVGVRDVSKRYNLRPVSQELAKFHPEYADIFQYNDDDNHLKSEGTGLESLDKENIFQGDAGLVNGDKDSLENKGRVKPSGHHFRASSETFDKPSNIELSRSNSVQARYSNSIPNGVSSRANGHISVDKSSHNVTKDSEQVAPVNGIGSHRANSDRPNGAPKGHAHKRFPSASVGLANKDFVILEDPHEQQDTPVQPVPSVPSLPAKNSFDLDYSFNLTYAQLAEFRRQARQAELDSRAGRKGPEDKEKTCDQFSVTSDGSSQSDLGKTKKRRAPLPPGGRRDSSPGRQSLTSEPPVDYELDDLPPRSGLSTPRKFSIQSQVSSSSSSSKSSKGPAPKIPALAPPSFSPPPPPARPPPAVSQKGSTTASTSSASATISDPPTVGNGVARSDQASQGPDRMAVSAAKAIAEARAELEALEKLKASWKLEEEKKEQEMTEEEEKKQQEETPVNACKNKDAEEEDGLHTTRVPDTTEAKLSSPGDTTGVGTDHGCTPTAEQKGQTADSSMHLVSSAEEGKLEVKGELSEASDQATRPPKLSSLLQHDIVLAAQARSAKSLVKTRMSDDRQKPKDQHELFREELQKSALAREQRRMCRILSKKHDNSQSAGNLTSVHAGDALKQEHVSDTSNALNAEGKTVNSDLLELRTQKSGTNVVNFPTMPAGNGTPTTRPDKNSDEAVKNEPIAMDPQPLLSNEGERELTALPVITDGVMDLSDEEMAVMPSVEQRTYDTPFVSETDSSGGALSRVFSPDWKPEDDLDSDDEIMDNTACSRSSAVLEASDGFKSSVLPSRMDDLKMSRRKPEVMGAESPDEQNKEGNIRKFRRSMHENVRSVFGSISTAPGKILKRGKSHDFGLGPPEVNGTHLDSPLSSIEKESTVVGTRALAFVEDTDNEATSAGGELSRDFATNVQVMKRAGVAYLGSKGQIVVLPDYESARPDQTAQVRKEDEWHVPKIFAKKKKFTYESTVRKKEKERVAQNLADEIRQREREMEMERVRQKDTELQFRRLRQAEVQQRLQTENFQHHQQDPVSASAVLVQRTPSSIIPHQHHHHQQRHLQAIQTSEAEMAGDSGQTLGPFTSANAPGAHLPVNMSSISPLQPNLYSGQTSVAAVFPAGHGPLASTTGISVPISMTPYTMNPPGVLTPSSAVGGYDVSYLNAYTTSLGLQPAAAKQQWAYLLGSVVPLDAGSQAAASGLYGGSTGPGHALMLPTGFDPTALEAQRTMTGFMASSGQPISDAAWPGSSQIPVPMVSPMPAVLMDMPATTVNGFGASFADTPGSGGDADFLVVGPDASRYYRDCDNPMYVSSDEEEEFSEHGIQNSLSAATSVEVGHQFTQRPHAHSTVLPPSGHSSAYHDVASAEGSAVTRVHVPDFSHVNLTQAQEAGRENNLGNSSRDDVVSLRGPLPFVRKDHTETGDSNILKGSTPTAGTSRQLPPKVYGPLGFKPVSFSRPNTWPSCSPDRNPIEQEWDRPGKDAYPQSLTALEEVWWFGGHPSW